ncbi:MAG: hypothetical protein SGARI_006207 [Bacillariaceae sp.]
MASQAFSGSKNHLPTMIVFDLDDCLWSPEMHELYSKPTIPVRGILNPHCPKEDQKEGVVGLSNQHGDTVRLYDGARRALYALVTDPLYSDVTIAVASTSLEPSYSHACLEGIEVLPGRKLRDVIQYDEIGRSESGVPYDEMLFFDGKFRTNVLQICEGQFFLRCCILLYSSTKDCNWGDHVGDIESSFGVTGQRTPRGLQFHEFVQGLESFKAKQADRFEEIRNMVR